MVSVKYIQIIFIKPHDHKQIKKSTTKNVTNYFVWEYQNINNSSDVEILFNILDTLIKNLK
jgi:hypothetical protein